VFTHFIHRPHCITFASNLHLKDTFPTIKKYSPMEPLAFVFPATYSNGNCDKTIPNN